MATPVNAGSILFGIGSQASAGTLATNPAYLFGVESGDIGFGPDFNDAPLTSGTATETDRELIRINVPFEYTTNSYLGSVGTIIKHALGDVTTTGSSPTFTHVFEHARPLPAGLSVFKVYEDGFADTLRDGKVETLRLEWDENAPLKVVVSGIGTVKDDVASVTPTTDETGTLTYFKPVGGTFKMDIDGTTVAARCVKGGHIELTNNLKADFCSGSYEASSISDNRHRAYCAMTVKGDRDEMRAMETALQAGGDLYGSIEWVFKSGTHTLKIEAKRVAFIPPALPASASGDEIEVELGGRCFSSTTWTSPVKITLTNDVAAY